MTPPLAGATGGGPPQPNFWPAQVACVPSKSVQDEHAAAASLA
eukprot:CAMPEP_0179303032 /NCGR_PEP_ID=MMETSP0797-20121207/48371_1 /TAXON_ID=47934 /ORGANISM="Dinophysis acuminata, Strain DAEP01" /LENGTH=42 /DNA_ID= /DNA_START= /DNA_END= /DNA_ORIENTATION=